MKEFNLVGFQASKLQLYELFHRYKAKILEVYSQIICRIFWIYLISVDSCSYSNN